MINSVSAEENFNVTAIYRYLTNDILIESDCEDGTDMTVIIGKYDADNFNSYTEITKSNIGEKVIYVGQAAYGDDGITVELESVENGFYAAYCGIADGSDAGKSVFYIASEDEYKEAFEAFENATKSNIAEVINKWCEEKPIINLDVENSVYTADKDAVHSIFLNNLAANENIDVQSLNTDFKNAIAIAEFNAASDKTAVLEKYFNTLKLEKADVFDANKESLTALVTQQSECKKGTISSYDDFVKAYNKSAALTELNNCTRDTVKQCLTDNAEIFGINAVSGYSSANADKVNAAMVYKDFKTPEAVKSAFEKAVKDNKKSSSGGSSGGGSSGGSSSGSSGGGFSSTNTVPVVSNGDTFTDLKGFEWAEDAIVYLKKNGILSGTGDGTFEPQRSIKREEFAKIITETFSIAKTGNAAFGDVDENAWYAEYVRAVHNAGIMNGMGEKLFGAGQNITRQDAVVILYRYLSAQNFEFKNTRDIVFADDEKIADYAKDAVYTMYRAGIVNGKDNNMFCPTDSISRAEASAIVYRVMNERGMTK